MIYHGLRFNSTNAALHWQLWPCHNGAAFRTVVCVLLLSQIDYRLNIIFFFFLLSDRWKSVSTYRVVAYFHWIDIKTVGRQRSFGFRSVTELWVWARASDRDTRQHGHCYDALWHRAQPHWQEPHSSARWNNIKGALSRSPFNWLHHCIIVKFFLGFFTC